MAEHLELGKKGEELARKFLLSKGYNILKTNWSFGKEEIDIIAEKGDLIVFVEVKTRKSSRICYPEASVTRKKQGFLIRAANNFVQQNQIENDARFDIIAIVITPTKPIINHLEGAFYPTL